MVSLQESFKTWHKNVHTDYWFSPYEESLRCAVALETSPGVPMLTLEKTCTQECHQLECIDFVSISLRRENKRSLDCITCVEAKSHSLSAIIWELYIINYNGFPWLREVRQKLPCTWTRKGSHTFPCTGNFTKQICICASSWVPWWYFRDKTR